MRISLVIPSFYPATVYGGSIFSTLHTCEALSTLDDVTVYVSTTNANGKSKLDVKANSWIKFNDRFFVKYYNETKIDIFSLSLFLHLWKDIKASDIVHIQGIFSTPTPIALICAFILKKNVLMSPRGSFCQWCLTHGSRFKKLWMRFVINPFGNHVTWHATSVTEKEDILKLYPNAHVYVVPNGISLEAYSHVNTLDKKAFAHKYTGVELSPSKIIVSMGRLHKVKGFDILIDSFTKVLKRYPNTILCIAGKDVGEKANLEKQIETLRLQKYIYFIGEITEQDKIDFLGNADLFVLPSHSENFGNVYLESLAAGTPIVASKQTPWSKVEAAGCGKWVNNSAEETSQAMLEMLEKSREQMRKNAKALAKKYDWANIALQFREVFKKMESKDA